MTDMTADEVMALAREKWKMPWAMMMVSLIILFFLSIFGLIFFRLFFVDFVDSYEVGYKFDTRTGQVTILRDSGYYVTPPFLVKIHTVDMRPMQVCINANSRVLNCKLVQFDPAGLDLFLSWHGRNDYEGPGGGHSTTTFSEILKSYAYEGSGKTYPFLKVVRELKNEETGEAIKK